LLPTTDKLFVLSLSVVRNTKLSRVFLVARIIAR
jgi:hypothetical protein